MSPNLISKTKAFYKLNYSIGMARSRNRTRFKTGNILLFLLIIGLIVFFFNRDKINKTLNDAGWTEVEQVEEVETETEQNTEAAKAERQRKKLAQKQSNDETDEKRQYSSQSAKVAEKIAKKRAAKGEKPQVPWEIVTAEEENTFYVNEENEFEIAVAEREVADFTPLPSKGAEIVEIDKAAGKYKLLASKTGPITISVMWKVDGKLDVLGEKKFYVKRRTSPKKATTPKTANRSNQTATKPSATSTEKPKITYSSDEYVWELNTEYPRTLKLGSNPITVAIGEVPVDKIRVELQGVKGKVEAVDAQKGKFNVVVEEVGTALLQLQIKERYNTKTVVEKEFIVKGGNKVATKSTPKQTDEKREKLTTTEKPRPKPKAQPSPKTTTTPQPTTKDNKDRSLPKLNSYSKSSSPTRQPPKKREQPSKPSPPKKTKSSSLPLLTVSGQSGGKISLFKLQTAKILEMSGVNANKDYKIISFVVTNKTTGQKAVNPFARFKSTTKKLLADARKGNILEFSKVKIQHYDSGKTKELSGLVFMVD